MDAHWRALRPLAAEIVQSEPERYRGTGADDLAAVATGFIEGCALQVVMGPQRFDVRGYVETVQALVAQPAARGWS